MKWQQHICKRKCVLYKSKKQAHQHNGLEEDIYVYVFLDPTFNFHVNAFRGEVDP